MLTGGDFLKAEEWTAKPMGYVCYILSYMSDKAEVEKIKAQQKTAK